MGLPGRGSSGKDERVQQVEGVSAEKASTIVKAAQAHVEQKRIDAEAKAAEAAAALLEAPAAALPDGVGEENA